MLYFEWNALREGDKVLAHDPRRPELTLIAGVVAQVDSHRRGRGLNRVGVNVAPSGHSPVILWPSRLAVHHDPHDATESCWRCQAVAQRAHERRQADHLVGVPAHATATVGPPATLGTGTDG